VESVERSLQSALVRGVVPIDAAAGPAVNAAVTLDRAAHRLAFKHQQSPLFDPLVLVLQREPEQGRWFNAAVISNATPGFGRTLQFSADGNTLAVEASPCAVTTMVCATSSVFVYAVDSFGTTWSERARFDGVRAPRLDQSGVRLLGIGVGARADTVAAFELRTGWWRCRSPRWTTRRWTSRCRSRATRWRWRAKAPTPTRAAAARGGVRLRGRRRAQLAPHRGAALQEAARHRGLDERRRLRLCQRTTQSLR
jgi:hypothetical protein